VTRRPPPGPVRHGTYLGYSSDGRRCGDCREAKAAYERARRAGDPTETASPWSPLAASCRAFLAAWEDPRTDALVLGSIAAGVRECVDDVADHFGRRYPHQEPGAAAAVEQPELSA